MSAYVRSKGARNVFEAPQSVDDAFWAATATRPDRRAPFQALFAGRDAPEKGLPVLGWRQAWNEANLPDATLVRAADAQAPSSCATSTRARTSWSYRRSPRATSSSRGAWW